MPRLSILTKTLKNWIANPTTDLSQSVENFRDITVKSETEAKAICDGLITVHNLIENTFDETIEENIYHLTVLFQQTETDQASDYLNDNGITLLMNVLDKILEKEYTTDGFNNPNMMILKMCALYAHKDSFYKLVTHMKASLESDDFLWEMIFRSIGRNDSKVNFVTENLGDIIPKEFIGICYLDMCNNKNIENPDFKHPFNTPHGSNYLLELVKNFSKDTESYVVSATVTIPFLDETYRNQLIEAIRNIKSPLVQMEAAWAGAKLNLESSIADLIAFTKDSRTSKKAVSYMYELDLDKRIPKEVSEPSFEALSEMSEWLSHPQEFGAFPDELEIMAKKELHWPPTDDKRDMYAIKYTYKNYHGEGKDLSGVGMVGSITFALFGMSEDLTKLDTTTLYGMYSLWEKSEEYSNLESAKEHIISFNPQLGEAIEQ